MANPPLLRYLIAGRLCRNYVITPQGKTLFDVPGGSLFHAAAGMGIWESGIGLVGRVGEDYPQEWLEQVSVQGFDVRGVRILPEAVDLRHFIAYNENNAASTDNPVSHFSRLELPFPKSLLGYTPPSFQLDSRNRLKPLTLRQNDIPSDYFDATAAHLCPLDYLSHTLLPSIFRQGNINTITLDPGENYMDPAFWDDIPVLVNGISAFLCSEDKLAALFQGRSSDPWEMAETLSSYGCEIVVIKRGSRGQYLYDGSSRARWIIPAYPVQMLDPTGAGDAFCGGFLAGFRSSYDPLHAALTGSVSAGMVIEGTNPFHALDALPGLAKARMSSLRETVRKA
jgi:hypothetical protein